MLTQKAVQMSITVPQNPRIIEGFSFFLTYGLKINLKERKEKKKRNVSPNKS